jgi:hypothetical protein
MLVAKVHGKELAVTGHDAVLVQTRIVQVNDILLDVVGMVVIGRRNATCVKEILIIREKVCVCRECAMREVESMHQRTVPVSRASHSLLLAIHADKNMHNQADAHTRTLNPVEHNGSSG